MLFFQDPTDPSSGYLLEQLLEACVNAEFGGGAFAWATSDGLKLVLGDPTFEKFVKNGSFDLVIGVDAVTNLAALAALDGYIAASPNLSAQVFLHNRPRTLFHPKMCWFGTNTEGTLITGSGNLTVNGLRGNWEAFTVSKLDRTETQTLRAQWAEWKLAATKVLRSTSDADVIAGAALNKAWQSRKRVGSNSQPEEAVTVEAGDSAEFDEAGRVLIAEIPRAGDRWNQANFDQASYEGFFGAKVGTQRRIVLRHVGVGGKLEELESRPSVEVISKNYRFELRAAAGIPYPATAPIGVFVQQPSGVFLYRLLLPTDSEYSPIAAILKGVWSGRSDRMKRVRMDVAELRRIWPTSPFWDVRDEK